MTMQVSIFRAVILLLIILNLIVSLLLLLRPAMLVKMNNVLSKWFSTTRFDEVMNRRRDIDQSILSSSKVFGTISLISSIALIYFYTKF